MKALRISLLLTLSILALGCRARGRELRHANHRGQQVVIHPGHVHSKYCGHYMAGDRWFYAPRHRHGSNCGHVLDLGVWILE